MNLRLGHGLNTLQTTRNNGPGWRVGLWTQGCVHRCTDRCLNPHFLDPAGGFLFPIAKVVEAVRRAVRRAAAPVEGVTILGGEPFEQADAVAAVLGPLRADGLSAMVYSGHTLEHLRRLGDAAIDRLLARTDLLVDGPYLPQFDDGRQAWRGSSNQRLLCLTGRYTAEGLAAAFAGQGKGFSLRLVDGAPSVSGLQERGGAEAVAALLRRPGR